MASDGTRSLHEFAREAVHSVDQMLGRLIQMLTGRGESKASTPRVEQHGVHFVLKHTRPIGFPCGRDWR